MHKLDHSFFVGQDSGCHYYSVHSWCCLFLQRMIGTERFRLAFCEFKWVSRCFSGKFCLVWVLPEC